MTAVGAPDFLTAQQWSDNAVIETGTFDSPHVLGPVPVSQWLGTSIYISPSAFQAHSMDVQFWADDAGSIPTNERRYRFGPNITPPAQITIPNVGAYMTITISAPVAEATAFFWTVIGTNRIGPTAILQDTLPLVQVFGGAIGAGATVNTDFAYFYAGPAHLFIGGAPATGEVRIDAMTLAGAREYMVVRRSFPIPAQFDFVSPIYLPPSWLRLVVVNTTGAASAYTATVAPLGWTLGQ